LRLVNTLPARSAPTAANSRRSLAVGCSAPISTGGTGSVGVTSMSYCWKNGPTWRAM
jgi:hypothetical protein